MTTNKAKEIAHTWHSEVNQTYDSKPYVYHLQMVYDYAVEFKDLIPQEILQEVLMACYLHDSIEDARKTYNDVKKLFGDTVAEIVYALTNEKGRTRKDRANEKYYEGIRTTQGASFVKICDRLANVNHSKSTNSRMLELYRKEYVEFKKQLYINDYEEMFERLEKLLK